MSGATHSCQFPPSLHTLWACECVSYVPFHSVSSRILVLLNAQTEVFYLFIAEWMKESQWAWEREWDRAIDKDNQEVHRRDRVRNWNGATRHMFSFCRCSCHPAGSGLSQQKLWQLLKWCTLCSIETQIMRPMLKQKRHSTRFLFRFHLLQLVTLSLTLFLCVCLPPAPCIVVSFDSFHIEIVIGTSWDVLLQCNENDRKNENHVRSPSFATFPNWMSFNDLRSNNGTSFSLSQSLPTNLLLFDPFMLL